MCSFAKELLSSPNGSREVQETPSEPPVKWMTREDEWSQVMQNHTQHRRRREVHPARISFCA